MFFIALLILSTTAIASAAAYFSVYGLAYTFSGVFWSVVAMGASLEAGKLIAASFLYRYWTRIGALLKTYLITGILALMFMTSIGIFGYLSSGYQQDVLPLKQKTEQVQLLEEERSRALDRKRQIDDLLAGSATVGSVEGKDGIDRNAVRALRETTRARESLVRQYRVEQTEVTKRVKELDAELLTLRQELIQVESHVGPITYIAKAFNLPTDDATKYLIFVIIFAFDPMAVALTLAVNIALRIRNEEKEAKKLANNVAPVALSAVVSNVEPLPKNMATVLADNTWDLYERDAPVNLEPLEFDEPKTVEPVVEPVVGPVVEPVVNQELGSPRRSRPYPNLMSTNDLSQAKINELVDHYRYLQQIQESGHTLSKDEKWELAAIKDVLQKNGFGHYL